jgi:hypothetical protein
MEFYQLESQLQWIYENAKRCKQIFTLIKFYRYQAFQIVCIHTQVGFKADSHEWVNLHPWYSRITPVGHFLGEIKLNILETLAAKHYWDIHKVYPKSCILRPFIFQLLAILDCTSTVSLLQYYNITTVQQPHIPWIQAYVYFLASNTYLGIHTLWMPPYSAFSS